MMPSSFSRFLKLDSPLPSSVWLGFFFRANSLTEAFQYMYNIAEFKSASLMYFIKSSKFILLSAMILFSVFIMLYFEFKAFRKQLVEVNLNRFSATFIITCIVLMGAFKNQADFIYFQF